MKPLKYNLLLIIFTLIILSPLMAWMLTGNVLWITGIVITVPIFGSLAVSILTKFRA